MRAIGLDQPLHMQPSDGHCCCYSKNSCCCGFCYRCSCSCSYLHSGFLQVQAPLLRGARYSAALQPAPAPAPVLPNRQLYPALDAAANLSNARQTLLDPEPGFHLQPAVLALRNHPAPE